MSELLEVPVSQHIELLFHPDSRDSGLQVHEVEVVVPACDKDFRVAVRSFVSVNVRASDVVGSEMAASVYGLDVLASTIEDNSQNQTRFLVLGRESAARTGRDKTCLLFSVTHEAGALVEVLDIFRRYRLNMTKIESHPFPTKTWEYYFFVDIEGHAEDENVKDALAEARRHCRQLEVLGSFPVAVTAE